MTLKKLKILSLPWALMPSMFFSFLKENILKAKGIKVYKYAGKLRSAKQFVRAGSGSCTGILQQFASGA